MADGTPVDAITDIAIDGIGRFYGVSYDTLYGINGYTAEVWPIAPLDTPLFGLTCTWDGKLVGGGDGLVEIDTLNGTTTTLVRRVAIRPRETWWGCRTACSTGPFERVTTLLLLTPSLG